MSINNSSTAITAKPAAIFNLSTKLTIGSAVCFSEGLGASIMAVAPQDQRFFIIASILSLVTWMAFLRFRHNKVGTDIADLCFYEFLGRIAEFYLYQTGRVDQDVATMFWYAFTVLSAARIIRVYLWQSSMTQQCGWWRFGPMTFLHAKHNTRSGRSFSANRLLAIEIIATFAIAVVASFAIRYLNDFWRVVVVWIIPLTFEFLYGPRQLRGVSEMEQDVIGSTQREADLAAKLAACEQKLALLQKAGTLLDEESAKVVADMRTLPEYRKAALMQIASVLAKHYGTSHPEKPDRDD